MGDLCVDGICCAKEQFEQKDRERRWYVMGESIEKERCGSERGRSWRGCVVVIGGYIVGWKARPYGTSLYILSS